MFKDSRSFNGTWLPSADFFDGKIIFWYSVDHILIFCSSTTSGWWFGTFFLIFPYIGNWEFHHPNWLSYFSEGRYTTNQYSVPVLHFQLNTTEYCHAKQPEDSPSSSWSTPKRGRSCGDPYGAQSSMASIAILETHAFFQVGAGHMFDHICILLDIIYSLSLGFTICFHYFPQLFQCILLSGYIKIYQKYIKSISKVYQVNSLNFCGYLSGKSQNLGRARSLLWIVQLESQWPQVLRLPPWWFFNVASCEVPNKIKFHSWENHLSIAGIWGYPWRWSFCFPFNGRSVTRMFCSKY